MGEVGTREDRPRLRQEHRSCLEDRSHRLCPGYLQGRRGCGVEKRKRYAWLVKCHLGDRESRERLQGGWGEGQLETAHTRQRCTD